MLRMLTSPHRPPDENPTLPPHLRPHHSLRFNTPAHTIFMLMWCTPNMLPTSLILTLAQVPSQYAPETNYPYACVVPSRHPPDTAYHPYARGVHSRHHLSLRLCGALPTCSRHHLSLRLCGALPTCSRHHLSLCLRSASQHAPDTTYPYASILHP
ncbi:hypothetical protein O181_106294 [Austropuccinia psidii MF-1]|uniref:Uncharacterized protein n=1 Tax=Austropuccinia psidii MF-1 TaxID=1389203 RepID=A0A9Q3JR50_9BASI|nr:hypothetical protein [Austropuccinia psidii MF-1]